MKYVFIFFTFCCSVIGFSQEISLKPFLKKGNSGGFSPDQTKILYEKKSTSKDQYYEIHVADSNLNNDFCVSCICKSIPQRHNGCSSWHPSGKYILFVGEKAEHPRSSVDAIPGFGAFTDIYIMTIDGSKSWKLTDIPNDYDHGIIAPRFSADGKKMVWVERKQRPAIFKSKQFFGLWQIKVADFVDGDEPRLSNIKTYEPGGDAFYETYGFSPDGKKIIFCSNMRSKHWYTSQIFTIDASTGKHIEQLTINDYNEHAHYTPDGKHIIWMTNSYGTQGCDWWMMRADGSFKQPLTYYNVKSNPMYYGKQVWAGAGFFTEDAQHFFGGVQTSLRKQEGFAVVMEFLPCGSGNGIMGNYFLNANFEGESIKREDAGFCFRWIPKQQDSLFTAKSYSIVWTAELEALYSEEYTFFTNNDKNISFWLDDQLLIGPKTSLYQSEKSAKLKLEKGKRYKLKVTYFNKTGANAEVKLLWKSTSQYKQIIPMSQLYH